MAAFCHEPDTAMRTTVIVPAYNAAATIERALRSALNQDPAPDAVIVANDGSTDATSTIAHDLGATVLDLPRSNGSVARNMAAARAEDSLLLFLDADDEWLPMKIATHLKAHEAHRPSMVFDPAIRVRPSGARGGVGGKGPEAWLEWQDLLDYRNWTSGSSFSVAKGRYIQVGGFNERLLKMQDVDFWVRCAHGAGRALRLESPLTLYHQSSASITGRRLELESYLPILFAGWPFATARQRQLILKEVYLDRARTSTLLPALRSLGQAGWPWTEGLFWRALLFSVRNSLQGVKP
jgi:glycosyltransferase involved in cell wall biosynthesis